VWMLLDIFVIYDIFMNHMRKLENVFGTAYKTEILIVSNGILILQFYFTNAIESLYDKYKKEKNYRDNTSDESDDSLGKNNLALDTAV
jgi:hypothetical protein